MHDKANNTLFFAARDDNNHQLVHVESLSTHLAHNKGSESDKSKWMPRLAES